MLKILKRIVQDVTTAGDLTQALAMLVKRVREAIGADAVSVYLIDSAHSEYVLIATDGLNKDAESAVRFALDQGIVGVIGRREEPINVDSAQDHPAFYHDVLLNEDDLNAFLGVPIIQHRRLYGVLAIQRREQRCFDDAEEAFVITLAAQLGGMIAHAEAAHELSLITQSSSPQATEKANAHQLVLSGLG